MCESPLDLHRCVVTVDGRRRTVDLCDEHVAPLAQLVGADRPRRGELEVVPFEYVETQRKRRRS